MVNKVILEGVLARAPYICQTPTGNKKALFTLEITTYEDGATTKSIELECYNISAEKIEKLQGGETIYAEGKLYRYKSTKNDCYMLAVSATNVEVKKAPRAVQQPAQQYSQPAPQPQINPEIYYEISDDDLPF